MNFIASTDYAGAAKYAIKIKIKYLSNIYCFAQCSAW